eukprot:13570464-Alexandrium_andersonii.AAC.1
MLESLGELQGSTELRGAPDSSGELQRALASCGERWKSSRDLPEAPDSSGEPWRALLRHGEPRAFYRCSAS